MNCFATRSLVALILGGAAATAAAATPQLLSPAKLATYRAALPHVADAATEAILRSADTLWYDHEVMIPSYQDSVGDGSFLPIGARPNNAGKAIIVPEGQKFFADDGETWSFPFGHTAGTDDADNIQVVDFLRLPAANGRTLPVAYWTTDDAGGLGGLGLHQWKWMYPVGTVIGELTYVKDRAGALFPAELRTRTRFADGWRVDAFRPFPTAASLAAAVQSKRPQWAANAALSRLVAQLDAPGTLTPMTRESPGFNGVVTLTGYQDVIPDFGDEALVKELLTTTTFTSAIGSVWKADGNKLTYAASTRAAFSIVPRNYFAGLIAVDDESCNRCHSEAGRSLESFEDATVLYGDLWGEDRIFSFHPYDQTRFGTFNQDNRQVRPELRGIVERYDPSKHPAQYYRQLDRPTGH